VAKLSEEDARALREGLDQETLAIFDLLKKPNLSKKDKATVKEVAIKTLAELKKEKLRIAKWRESTQVTSQVRTMIFDSLQYLPQDAYADDEVVEKAGAVYQHVFATYNGGVTAPLARCMCNYDGWSDFGIIARVGTIVGILINHSKNVEITTIS
jgi:type I restriction enzyme R subunit